MKNPAISALGLWVALAGCATASKSAATDASVLADAKSRSASYCAKYAEGCKITSRRTEDGGWTASVSPVVRGSDGGLVNGIDLDDFYIYDNRGRFSSALRGY